MVSPAEGWEDTENGYQTGGGSTRIYILPVQISEANRMQSIEVIEGDEDADCWELMLAYQNHEMQKSLTKFKNVRTAWEFANLITHYISFFGPMSATGDFKPHTGGGLPDVVEEGRDGDEVYREALGDREYMLDNALEENS